MASRITITACLVVYNEEPVIRRCLDSLTGVVDEIVVVHDGPCYDSTLDICRDYTEKVFVRPRIGIAEPHRVFSYEQATGDWILKIDADEFLSPELQDNLRSLVMEPDVDLYYFLWPYTDGRRFFSYGSCYPSKESLARRSKMYFWGLPGQPMRTYGNVRRVSFRLMHKPNYNNFTFHRFKTKWLLWAQIIAKWIWKSPDDIPCYGVIDKEPLIHMLENYRRRPLLSIPLVFARRLAWFFYNGIWQLGTFGLRIAILSALHEAAIRYYIFKYKPKN